MPGESLNQGSSRFPRVAVDHDSPQRTDDQPTNFAILDAIKQIKEGFDSKMSTLGDKLDGVSDWPQEVESRQNKLEDLCNSLSSSAANPQIPIPGKCVRRTPPALQVGRSLV